MLGIPFANKFEVGFSGASPQALHRPIPGNKMYLLEFEKPIMALKSKLDELKARQLDDAENKLEKEISKLEKQITELEKSTYSTLNPWEKTQLARHPQRPCTLDFIKYATADFTELHGDRAFRDDPAIVGGFCRIEGQTVMVIGHQKGSNTTENLKRNFGMPHPEGYRKALRLMKLAQKFGHPILTLIDTPGAYPGIGAEERGQSEAIAVNLREMAGLTVPVVCAVSGEGGSGGALALGVGNRILMLEHAIYSVITPEGCASILFGDGTRAQEAAKSLRYSAQDLMQFGLIDEVVPEPVGGAHAHHEAAMLNLKKAVAKNLRQLGPLQPAMLIDDRVQKFRAMGAFAEG